MKPGTNGGQRPDAFDYQQRSFVQPPTTIASRIPMPPVRPLLDDPTPPGPPPAPRDTAPKNGR